MKEISLHILDIAENSVNADAKRIEIVVSEHIKNDKLTLLIKDDGRGMDSATVQRISDPFVTSRTTRKVGLGIPFLKAAAEACQGGLEIRSQPGRGTEIEVTFQHSHIDRMPLGDLQATFLQLLIGYPHVHWVFRYRMDEREFCLDDAEIKQTLEDVPLSDPAVISFLRQLISNGFEQVRGKK